MPLHSLTSYGGWKGPRSRCLQGQPSPPLRSQATEVGTAQGRPEFCSGPVRAWDTAVPEEPAFSLTHCGWEHSEGLQSRRPEQGNPGRELGAGRICQRGSSGMLPLLSPSPPSPSLSLGSTLSTPSPHRWWEGHTKADPHFMGDSHRPAHGRPGTGTVGHGGRDRDSPRPCAPHTEGARPVHTRTHTHSRTHVCLCRDESGPGAGRRGTPGPSPCPVCLPSPPRPSPPRQRQPCNGNEGGCRPGRQRGGQGSGQRGFLRPVPLASWGR